MFVQYELFDKVVAYIKDASANLNTFTPNCQVLYLVFHYNCHNPILPFVMGMQYQNVVNMLLMNLRYVVEYERSLLRMPNILCKRLLLGQKKVAKIDMNRLWLVEMHPFALRNWKLMWKSDLHPMLCYSKRH